MTFSKKPLRLHLTVVIWVLVTLWNAHTIAAAPVKDDNSTGNGTLTDPFSTPDYLAPSKFTWEQCIYGLFFIFFGGVEVLHGYKYIRITMLVAGFLVWASTAVMIMLIVESGSGAYQSSGVYFLVWFLVGIIGALISFYLWHVGIILTGAYGGFVVLAVIFTAANVQSFVFRYTFLAIVLIASGFLTHRYERIAVILATSFGGAYCMMFGLDMFVQTEFRATFHVMLSQSSSQFHPNAGTWVMVACVPLIAIFGIIWELKHHEEPVGSWWFGHGARPLPPLPGQEKPRRCCGCIPMSRSAKAAAAAETSTTTTTPVMTAPNSGSDATLVPKPPTAKPKRSCCLGLCGKRKPAADKGKGSQATPGTTTATPTSATAGRAPPPLSVEKIMDSHPLPVEKAHHGGEGHETIGHTGVHKVVIQREVREFSVDIEERW
ncbi:hypothetical protein BGZ83_011161 [Gryganskiella cystojenkinii]|nr:hypothetical protein BGZ83_011161 [Gryganskiella cystojenkinii]